MFIQKHIHKLKKQGSLWMVMSDMPELCNYCYVKCHLCKHGTGTEELKATVKTLEREVHTKLSHSYWWYMSIIFTPSDSEEDSRPSPKWFWTYIKHQRSTSVGVPALKVNGWLEASQSRKQKSWTASSTGPSVEVKPLLTRSSVKSAPCQMTGATTDPWQRSQSRLKA